ncbi:MAG: DNA polymerase IV [Bacteroidetes bacterium]|nr:DNA polymerase IV [Bacteroidota bacterium]MBT3749510.1 DNA polymerase IV [Bacteroidota bacterium]MBT4410615.1 DNA polymerase IV [Bacteroidota bacterium]MBT5424546.1 DNA polymerase IV [Bacteroidota bacterium]MBT7092948.1 DNA polymerase IV [Bacteroidota bacterium]
MSEINRIIAHFDLDTFFVSVERLINSQLIGKPVIIGGLSDRGVVSSCSYEARTYGVHSAMPIKMARQLCSDGIYIRGDMEAYSKQSRLVTDIIAEKAPLYEKASIDEHYLDITGMDRFFGSLIWTHELRQRIIKETGLPISFGLSVNKTVSKIATGEAKPNGEKEVAIQDVQNFLNPLSIKKIPMLGPKTYQLLRSMGVLTIKTLSDIPPDMLGHVLGKNGMLIWKKANGIDHTPVHAYWEQKSISTERTYDQDTTDVKDLNRRLITMVEKIAFELRKQEKLTACITVKIRYANFDTHTMQKRLIYTSFDHIMIETAQELFKRLYTRRMRIRLIGVRLSNLIHGTQQLNLFEDTPEQVNLYLAMDRMRKRYGSDAIRRAIGVQKDEGLGISNEVTE